MLALDECRQRFYGSYALRHAARQGHVEEVRSLLASGVHPDHVSRQHHRLFRPWVHARSALWHAVANGHMQVVDTLLSHGANPNAVGWMAATPLWTACCTGQVEMVVRLLAAGADPNLPGCRGSTPLMAWMGTLAIPRAVDQGYVAGADPDLEIGRLLDHAGASLDGVDDLLNSAASLLRLAGYPADLLSSTSALQALRSEQLSRMLQRETPGAMGEVDPLRL